MKINIASANQQQTQKINKRPQLALDAAFKQIGSGVDIYFERHGQGKKTVEGSQLKVHYEGWLEENYKMFDSSRVKRRPFEFELGKGTVIAGWDIALKDVRQGTKMQIRIPAKLAYGRQGVKSMGIPPNANLIFKVEVLKVS